MNRLTDIVIAVSRVIHLVKPLVLEAVLFAWAMAELGRFAWSVIMGQ